MGEVKLERSDPTFANFTKAHDHENMLLGPLLGLWNVRVQVRTPEASASLYSQEPPLCQEKCSCVYKVIIKSCTT